MSPEVRGTSDEGAEGVCESIGINGLEVASLFINVIKLMKRLPCRTSLPLTTAWSPPPINRGRAPFGV